MRVADHDESTVREVGASGFRLIEDQSVGGVDGHEIGPLEIGEATEGVE